MAEYASIPARLNGSPIPDLSDVSVQLARTVNQQPVVKANGKPGVKITYGVPKWQCTFTFKTLKDRQDFLDEIGALDDEPDHHDFGFDLGGVSFSLLQGVPSGLTASSNQDGDASLQYSCMYEDFQKEG